MKNLFFPLGIITFSLLSGCQTDQRNLSLPTGFKKTTSIGGIYLGNGIKTGEVQQTEAIFWARTTLNHNMVKDGIEFISRPRKNIVEASMTDPYGAQVPEGKSLGDMNGSLVGLEGEIRFTYYPSGSQDKAVSSPWLKTEAQSNYIGKYRATDLVPGSDYVLITECRTIGSDQSGDQIIGSFKTAPLKENASEPTFVVVTCGDYPRRDDKDNGHVIYDTMLKLEPDFFVHTGDIEYYDKPNPFSTTETLARYKWDRLYALPYLRKFHNQVTSYFMKDDHDTTMNDSFPGRNFGALTWEDGIRIFKEQFPLKETTYRNVRWGKHLEVWMVEGRDYRSANREPDGPNKSIWGKEQKAWLFKTFKESNATFRILISPTPIVGPDRPNKNDNHANRGFKHEGDEVRKFISEQKNAFIICGDRHWQYHSIDPQLGIHEFSCGPSSDNHASGYSETKRNEYHQYLKVLGGFLSVSVKDGQQPKITFQHHSPKGDLRYSKSFTSK